MRNLGRARVHEGAGSSSVVSLWRAPVAQDQAVVAASTLQELSAIGIVLIPSIALIWSLSYWPGYHDSIHIAIAHVLRSLETPGSPFEPFLEGHLTATTYSLHYWALLALSHVVSLPVANRIITTALTVLGPLALYFAAARLSRAQRSNVILYAPFGLSWTIVMGMHAFAASLSAAFVGWALVVGSRETHTRGRRAMELAGAALAFAVGVLAHPFAVALGGILVVAHSWGELLSPRRLWPVALAFLPALAILGASQMLGWHDQAGEIIPVRPASIVSAALALAKAMTATSCTDLAIHIPIVGLVGWGIVRRLRRRGAEDRGLLRALIVTAVLLGIIPDLLSDAQLGFRVAQTLLMLAFVFADVPLRFEAKTALALAVAIGGFFVQRPVLARQSKTVEERMALASEIPRGSTLLPIDFRPTRGGGAFSNVLFEPRVPPSISVMPNAWGYLVETRDVTTPFLWAAGGTTYMSGASFRPLRYKRHVGAEFLPLYGLFATTIVDTPGFCAGLRLEAETEDCAVWRRLRYRAFVWMGLAYDRVLVAYPPAAFMKEIDSELELVAQKDQVYLFQPKPGRARPTLERFLAM